MDPLTVYCAKCRTHTETTEKEKERINPYKIILKGKCAVCGTRKCTFLKIKTENALPKSLGE